MVITYNTIIKIFRYLWLILGLSLILYIVGKNIITERILTYELDFSQSISSDITGWHPESRTHYLGDSQQLYLKGEPVYMQIYLPLRFDSMTVKGTIDYNNVDMSLGLRQEDGTWMWQAIKDDSVDLVFSLDKAKLKSNKLEIILSAPNIREDSNIYLQNNWQLVFER